MIGSPVTPSSTFPAIVPSAAATAPPPCACTAERCPNPTKTEQRISAVFGAHDLRTRVRKDSSPAVDNAPRVQRIAERVVKPQHVALDSRRGVQPGYSGVNCR